MPQDCLATMEIRLNKLWKYPLKTVKFEAQTKNYAEHILINNLSNKCEGESDDLMVV